MFEVDVKNMKKKEDEEEKDQLGFFSWIGKKLTDNSGGKSLLRCLGMFVCLFVM